MKLKYSLSDLKRKFEGSAKNVTGANADNGSDRQETALVLFRTLSVLPFSYPFGSESKVRDAIRLSVTPLVGDGDRLSVVPVFTEQTKNSSRGCSFIVSTDELNKLGNELPQGISVWPAPLAFISEVDGNGLVVCIGDGVQGILFEEGVPTLSHWMAEGDMEGWFKRYAENTGRPIDRVFTADLSLMEPHVAETARAASILAMPGLKGFTLSREAAKRRAGADSFISAAFTVLKAAAGIGMIFLILACLFFIHSWIMRDRFASLPSAVYLKAFGEPSASPVRTALKKAASLPGQGTSATIEDTLGTIAYAFNESEKKLRVESIKYGPAVSEVQGNADDAESAEKFRTSLTQRGFTAKMSDIRQIPSAGMRFTITLERNGSR